MLQSTKSPRARKYRKPRPDFPLWPHPSGRWCKKVPGRAHYFGKVADDPSGQAALVRCLAVKDDLLGGRTPRVSGQGLTVRGVCNRFLTSEKALVQTDELSSRTFPDYHASCKLVVETFGKSRLVTVLDTEDFRRLQSVMARSWARSAWGTRCRGSGRSSSGGSTPA